jgi:programmed cell death 6-interacting protein
LTDHPGMFQVFDILDQEAIEEEMLHERYADIDTIRQPSHQANAHLVEQAERYRATLTQAKKSDGDVLLKWQEWVNLIGILAGGEVRATFSWFSRKYTKTQ